MPTSEKVIPPFASVPEELPPLASLNGNSTESGGADDVMATASKDGMKMVPDHSGSDAPAAEPPTTCCGCIIQEIRSAAQTVIPYGGFVSCCFSLCSVTLGGGVIGMPSAFQTSGIIIAVFYLVVVTVLTVYTMTMIGFAMRHTGYNTFERMAFGLFGRGGDYFVGFVMWLSCVGTAIGYISGVSSLVQPILQTKGMPAYLQTPSGNRLVTSAVWLCCMSPLIIPKRINSLRYFSAFSVFFVLLFVMAVVIHACTHGFRGKDEGELVLMNTNGPEAINGLSIFIFAYLCHGVAYPVFFEMRPRKSVKKLAITTTISMTICMFFYLLAGIFGYMEFGSKVEGSILYNYDPVHEPLMMVAYIGILIKLCTAYAMNMIPVRNFTYYVLDWEIETLPYWKHIITITLVSTAVLVAGLFIPSINTAFGLVGSLCGGFIAFIFPALFWMYCGNWSLKTVGIWHYLATYFVMVCGVIAIVFGTAITIWYSFIDTA